MARRPQPQAFYDVRVMSIEEIVQFWTREIDYHPITLRRELRRYLLNGTLDYLNGERIAPDTPDEDLPPPETLVDREWLRLFCVKKEWELPRFWFPPDPQEVQRQGRPSIKPAIVREFNERLERGENHDQISDEARAIFDTLTAKGVAGVPEAKTIQGHIRQGFNARQTIDL